MNNARIILLLGAGLLALAGCKSSEDEIAAAGDGNPLLAYVPAETPYLIANLEPTPADVVDAYLERFQPTFELVQAMLDDVEVEINSDGTDDLQDVALVAALVNELDGKLNRDGLESLGLALESHKAFYGMGTFPLMRVALRDAEALRAAIGRIEADAGMPFPELDSGGTAYYRIAPDGETVGIYIAILADHLAMGVFPVALEAEILPNLLAQAEPDDRFDAGAELAGLNAAKGFLAHGSGYFDFRKLAAEFLLPESRTHRGFRATGIEISHEFDATCTAEIGSLIDKAPRLVFGTTELSAEAIGIKYQLEMEPGLAGELTKLVSDVPPAGEGSTDIAEMSLALQVGRVRAFLLEKVTARSANPFTCPQLQALNGLTDNAMAALGQPLPPFVGNLNGFRLRLQDIDFSRPEPQTSRALFVLEVEKPQMLVGSAQMFVPGLDGLALEAGADPVEVPQELMTVAVDGVRVFAAMSKDAIGLSLGENQSEGLAEFLDADGDNSGTFFSVDFDMSAQAQFRDMLTARGLTGHDGHDHHATEQPHMPDLLKRAEQSYWEMLGRSRTELRFTPEGFEAHSRVTFN